MSGLKYSSSETISFDKLLKLVQYKVRPLSVCHIKNILIVLIIQMMIPLTEQEAT